MKVNIEGAEWFLFNDIIENDLNKHIKIWCGSGHDVEKVVELHDKVEIYYKLLKENKIHIHRFTEWKPHLNADLKEMIAGEAKKIIKEKNNE